MSAVTRYIYRPYRWMRSSVRLFRIIHMARSYINSLAYVRQVNQTCLKHSFLRAKDSESDMRSDISKKKGRSWSSLNTIWHNSGFGVASTK